MQIILKNMAQVTLPEESKAEVLSMYMHSNKVDTIRTYRYKDGIAYLPPNMTKLKIVANLIGAEIVDGRSVGAPLEWEFEQNPAFMFRDHQVLPAQELLDLVKREKYAVLKANCGGGKTVVMSYVAGCLGGKVLILVDMGSLLSQWQEAFEMVWNRKVQILDSKTTDIGDVCISTFQMLHANPELVDRVRKEFATLLLDEFHTTAANTRREILIQMNNQYRIGCTASLMKKGYDDDVLTDMVSDRCVVMKDEKELKPIVTFLETGSRFCSSSADDWGKIQSELGKDLYRNHFISNIIIEQIQEGRKVLVVGVSIVSLKQIAIYLKKSKECKPIVYIGSTSLKQDKALKVAVESGECNCILSSKKFDKGLDVPLLDCLILAKPNNNQAFCQQVAGRIVRAVEGKPRPIIIDMVDAGSLATGFAKNRSRWYSGLGYEILS